MATITLKGNPIETSGELPAVGEAAPDFKVTTAALEDVSLSDYAGQKLLLNIFPSIDTPVCASSVRRFNEAAAGFDNTKILCISADLPFAHSRFCGGEGIENVVPTSTFRSDFGKDYGVTIATGPLSGVLARAIVVVDEEGKVKYTELVPEIAQEPNYDGALNSLA